MCRKVLWLICVVLVLALASGAQAEVFSDDFETMHEYLSEGPGAYDGLIDSGLTMLNSSLIQPGVLYMESAGASWDPGPGPLLYVEVAGDFVATVRVADYAGTADAYVYYNNCGLVARAVPEEAGPGEDWIAIDYFPLYDVGNIVRYADDGIRFEDVGGNGMSFGADTYLQIERVGNTFYLRTSPDGETWVDYPDPAFSPLERPDLDGLPLQVGLAQATFTPDVGYVAFDDFSIVTPDKPKASIMWISDNKGFGDIEPNTPGDQGWVDLLTQQGYEVIYKNQNEYIDGEQYWRTLDPNKTAELEAVDLIILSRNADSGSYSSGSDNEPNLWNGVTTPLISLSAHMSRSNKWGWMNSTGTTYTKDAKINVVDPTSVIFAGVVADANDQVEAYSAQWNMDWVTGATDAGNGKVLATRSSDGLVSVATWEAGQEYYDGGAVAGGPRMLFIAGTGSKNSGSNYAPDGMYNLTADGERMFLNAVGYMLNKSVNIIYVCSVRDIDQDGFQDDVSWEAWLEGQGYTVDNRPGQWSDPLDANDIAELEAADLIIASRGMSTGEFDGSQVPLWNGVSTPIICTNAWMIRSNRWKWMNSKAANKDAGAPLLVVEQADHPIFAGIETMDGVVEILDPNVASGHTSFLSDEAGLVGNGTMLASSLGLYNTTWIAEWFPGFEYYDGAGEIPAGRRLLFMAGTQDDPYESPTGVGNAPVGVLNLNEAGRKMFLNAIEYMLGE